MPLQIIRTVPDEAAYTPLSTFQSETPASFSTPVLHYRQQDSKVLLAQDQARLLPIFGAEGSDGTDEITVEGIELWVTNENLIFFNRPLSVGAVIPYLSLTLHAVQRVGSETGLYMQISLTPDISSISNPDEHDDEELVELTLIPITTGDASQADVSNDIFKALTLCTSLHSAASNSDDEDGGEDRILFENDADRPVLEGFPGQGGWITAENVDQFQFADVEEYDPHGTTILGPGAGSVRQRDEGEGDTETAAGDGTDESKWRKTG